jgi:hypothetical protein
MTLDARAGLLEACRRISPTHPDYAVLPIEEGFDWSPLAGAAFDRLYLVVFRSVRRETADLDLLRRYDDRAYAEALKHGGLLRYFKGEMDEFRRCLSFCLWESREDALVASGGAKHTEAASITAEMYESYRLYRYDLLKPATGDLLFQPLGEQAQEFGASSRPQTYAKRG